MQPVKTQPFWKDFLMVCSFLQLSASWSAAAAAAAWSAWSAAWSAAVAAGAAAVAACAAASGQVFVSGQRTKRFVKGREYEKRKSIRSAVGHGQVDERIGRHEVEFIKETIGM